MNTLKHLLAYGGLYIVSIAIIAILIFALVIHTKEALILLGAAAFCIWFFYGLAKLDGR
jgi:hypothetical protein